MDDGITFDRVVSLPVVQSYGVLVTHSASSGVVSEKEGVDGRERLRIIFALEEEVHTELLFGLMRWCSPRTPSFSTWSVVPSSPSLLTSCVSSSVSRR